MGSIRSFFNAKRVKGKEVAFYTAKYAKGTIVCQPDKTYSMLYQSLLLWAPIRPKLVRPPQVSRKISIYLFGQTAVRVR
jgi:hypothetical protein